MSTKDDDATLRLWSHYGVKSINFTPCGGIYRIFSHLAPALFKFPLIKPIRHIVICNLSEIGSWNLENLEISLRIFNEGIVIMY